MLKNFCSQLTPSLISKCNKKHHHYDNVQSNNALSYNNGLSCYSIVRPSVL